MRRFAVPLLTLLLAVSPLAADTRKGPIVTPLEIDDLGLPVIRVTLHSKGTPDITRTFRFFLDTGAGVTVVDRRIPPSFLWEDPDQHVQLTDTPGESRKTAMAFLKRLDVGGMIQDDLRVAVQDLHELMGRFQDQPIDGILGLDVLNRTRFTLDMKTRQVTWWAQPLAGMVPLKAGRGSDGMVYALIHAGKEDAPALVDTGLGGGFSLPEQHAPEGGGIPTHSEGLFGGTVPGRELRLPRLSSGDLAWLDVPVSFEPKRPAGAIGTEVWSCGPVWFDLLGSPRIMITPDDKGHLPFQRTPTSRLPLAWEASGATRRMIVFRLRPDSDMAKAGCQVGDHVIQVGDLKGERLTRRAVQDLVASGKPHTWTVRREGKEIQIAFHQDSAKKTLK